MECNENFQIVVSTVHCIGSFHYSFVIPQNRVSCPRRRQPFCPRSFFISGIRPQVATMPVTVTTTIAHPPNLTITCCRSSRSKRISSTPSCKLASVWIKVVGGSLLLPCFIHESPVILTCCFKFAPGFAKKSSEGVLPQHVFGSGVSRSTEHRTHIDYPGNSIVLVLNLKTWSIKSDCQVDESSLYSFDWEKEEALLRQDVEDDQCLTMQLQRLRLRRAVDFDDWLPIEDWPLNRSI